MRVYTRKIILLVAVSASMTYTSSTFSALGHQGVVNIKDLTYTCREHIHTHTYTYIKKRGRVLYGAQVLIDAASNVHV